MPFGAGLISKDTDTQPISVTKSELTEPQLRAYPIIKPNNTGNVVHYFFKKTASPLQGTHCFDVLHTADKIHDMI